MEESTAISKVKPLIVTLERALMAKACLKIVTGEDVITIQMMKAGLPQV